MVCFDEAYYLGVERVVHSSSRPLELHRASAGQVVCYVGPRGGPLVEEGETMVVVQVKHHVLFSGRCGSRQPTDSGLFASWPSPA